MRTVSLAKFAYPPPHKVLVALLAACAAFPAAATQYKGPLSANESGNAAFDAIKAGSAEEGFVYNFQDGDEIISSPASRNFIVGGSGDTDLTLTGNIAISGTASGSDYVEQFNGLYVWVGTAESYWILNTDDVSVALELSGTSNSGSQWVNANGIYNVWGETQTGGVEIDVKAIGDNAYVAMAQGLITTNGGKITIDGGSIKAVAQNDGYATQAFGVSTEGHNERADSITSNGSLDIIAKAVNTSNDTGSFAAAYGVNNAQTSTGPSNVVNLDNTSIIAESEAAYGTAEAIGVYGGNLSQTTVGEGTIEVKALSLNGFGMAYGIYADNGVEKIVKESGDITVKGSSLAAGIYANDGIVEYGGGTITASMISEDIEPNAAGIYTGVDASVLLLGDTDVEASSALVGAGSILVAESVSAGFNGNYSEFTGGLAVRGTVGLGMTSQEASRYINQADTAALVLYAGYSLEGNYVVGSEAQTGSSAAESSLSLLSDGTLVIVAAEDYDGTSPLVTVDSASTENSSVIRLVNSARVVDGTQIFNLLDENAYPNDFIFETDNLLTEIVDNRIVKKSAESVFGSDLLIPNTVNSALNGAQGNGADRIIDLTSDSHTPKASGRQFNRIALMSAGGGAQIAASNAVILVDESIMRHGSKLVSLGRVSGSAGLWVDLNGSFSRADDFKAGKSSYGFKSDLAGGILGADYSFMDNLTIGVALSFGTGSVRGQGTATGTKNKIDYWGINLYGTWDVGIANLIGSIGWLQSKNDITQSGFNGEPDVSAFMLSARAEKSFELGTGYSITPHIGVRWTHLNMDDFSAGGFDYRSENVNLVSFPVGLAVSNAFSTTNGFIIKPYLDFEIAPNTGDKETSNQVGLVGSTINDVIDTRIASSVVYSARLGFSGTLGNSHEFGLYCGIAVGNGDYVSQQLKAGYRFVF